MENKTDQNVCPLCTTTMTKYGVGKCNHIVCGICAIRMRVICRSKECPVCRQHLERVFITKIPTKFDHLDQAKHILVEEFDLLFESKLEEQYYKDLMTCKCQICGHLTRSMSALHRHYNNNHQLMFCDLCLNNLKLFPVEFPVYTGADLVEHRRWSPEAPGRGHPLCKFCDRRYYDADDWYKHLRRDHFMCHVCEREAASTTTKRTVFGNYEHLLEHCRTAHFVCEEGSCAQQQFTNMFASETELKAHRLTHHNLTKAEARENRRIDVEIRFVDGTAAEPSIHRGGGTAEGGRGGGSGRGFRKNREPPPESSGLGLNMRNLPGMAESLAMTQTVDANQAARANGEVPYEENPQDFPTLGGHAPDFNRPGAARRPSPVPRADPEAEEDLWAAPKPPAPAAAPAPAPTPVPAFTPAVRQPRQSRPRPGELSNDFPALSAPVRRQPAAGVWQGGATPAATAATAPGPAAFTSDAFPSLGGAQRPASASALPWRPAASQGRKGAVPASTLAPTKASPAPAAPASSKVHAPPAPAAPSRAPAGRGARWDEDDAPRGPSFAEERVGRRLTAAEAFESAATPAQAKVQLVVAPEPAPATHQPFRMDAADFPAIGGGGGGGGGARWGPSGAPAGDLYLELAEPAPAPAAPPARVVPPDVASAADFPALGPAPRTEPQAVSGRARKRRSRQVRPPTPEAPPQDEPPVPISAPFSLGDLAASLIDAQYREVPDMDERNRVLFEALTDMLGPRFDAFLRLSTRYRNREVTARSYLEGLEALVGKREVAAFMPEMLVLLPDIGLQKSLLVVMEPELRRHLRECSTCGQVVTTADLPFHLSVH